MILGLIIGSCLGVGYVCFQITNMGLSTMIESRKQIQRKVVQLVIHNVVKGGWKVAFHSRQKNIACLMHKVGHF
jgi:ABC-type antimicrobial peptide transport system ATPase subunit